MKSYCTALALLGLAAPTFGQKPEWLLQYPSNYVTGPATQACIGMFSDDLEADAALLAGGDVFLIYAPGRVSSFSKLTGPFTSIAKVPLDGCASADGLLASSSSGLELLQWDGTRQFVATSVWGSSDWIDVVELQVVPSVGNSGDWICGLSSTRDTVYYAQLSGGSIGGIQGSFRLLLPALTLAGLDWDGDGALDFAVDSAYGAELLDLQGNSTFLNVNYCSQPRLLRFDNGGLTDDLVWLTKNPISAGPLLTVIHSSNSAIEVPIPANPLPVAELTIADVDGNGLNDVVATRADFAYAHVLYHQNPGAGVPTLGLYSPVTSDFDMPSLVAAYNTPLAFPAVASGDLDGDGDDDLLFAGQPGVQGSEVLAWFGKGFDEEADGLAPSAPAAKVWLSQLAVYSDWIWPNVPVVGPDLATLVLHPKPQPTSGPASTANKIRVTVWARESQFSAIEPMRLVDSFFDADTAVIQVQIPLPPDIEELPLYLVTQMSYVDVANGVITRVLPGWTGQFNRETGILPPPNDGPTTTGGVNQPQPPPSHPPPIP